MQKILVIAPHPDDEVLGCGGTIKKYTQRGAEVSLCVVTSAYTPEWSQEFVDNRPHQIRAAADVLGIDPDRQEVTLSTGKIPYDYLIVSLGLQTRPEMVPGFTDRLMNWLRP